MKQKNIKIISIAIIALIILAGIVVVGIWGYGYNKSKRNNRRTKRYYCK